MHIGVFSPNTKERNQAEQNLEAFGAQAHLTLHIWQFTSQEEILDCLSKTPLDILIFDTTGVDDYQDKVREVVRTIPTCLLILAGNDLTVAVFGYSVGAKNYLSTPLGEEDLVQAVALLVKQQLENRNQVFPVYSGGAWMQLPSTKLTLIESAGHYLYFYMDDGVVVKTNATFRDYEWNIQLCADLLRCHQSYVVNLRYVKSQEKSQFTMQNGYEVNISRPHLSAARSEFSRYQVKKYNT